MKGQKVQNPDWACPVQSVDTFWAQVALTASMVWTPQAHRCTKLHMCPAEFTQTAGRQGGAGPSSPAWPLRFCLSFSGLCPAPCSVPCHLQAVLCVARAQDRAGLAHSSDPEAPTCVWESGGPWRPTLVAGERGQARECWSEAPGACN